MNQGGQPERLGLKFVVGLIWLSLLAVPLGVITRHSIALMLVMLLLGSQLCSGLVLWWMALWASRRESRLGQFSVGSLLFAALFVAMFLGFVRWIMVASVPDGTVLTNSGQLLGIIALVLLVWLLLSIRILAGLTEAVLWGAVWVLNRPGVRRWRRRNREVSERMEDS